MARSRPFSRQAEQHIAECAEEMGIDLPEARSCESSVEYKGQTIEVWYDENGSVYAWKAFVKGIGTSSGTNKEEAIAEAKRKIERQ